MTDVLIQVAGVLYAAAGLALAFVLWRRPLTDKERPWAAALVLVVALAAMAYRTGKLEELL